MRIVVTGRLPRQFGIATADFKSAVRFLADSSSRRVGGVWHEVVVHLVRDAESDAMHRAIMGIAGATDVITQAYDAIPPEAPGLFGDTDAVENNGFEPLTPCLQSRCSSQLS